VRELIVPKPAVWIAVAMVLLVAGLDRLNAAEPENRAAGHTWRWELRILTSGSPWRLLQWEAVRQELGLSPQQRADLDEARRQLEKALEEKPRRSPSSDSLPNLSRRRARRRARAAAMEGFRRRVDEILSADQQRRLGQLRLQLQLPAALSETHVAVDLAVTPAQREQLEAIAARLRQGLRRLRSRPSGTAAEQGASRSEEQIEQEVQRLRHEAIEQALGVLTPEQKQRLDALQGEPFRLEDDASEPHSSTNRP